MHAGEAVRRGVRGERVRQDETAELDPLARREAAEVSRNDLLIHRHREHADAGEDLASGAIAPRPARPALAEQPELLD